MRGEDGLKEVGDTSGRAPEPAEESPGFEGGHGLLDECADLDAGPVDGLGVIFCRRQQVRDGFEICRCAVAQSGAADRQARASLLGFEHLCQAPSVGDAEFDVSSVQVIVHCPYGQMEFGGNRFARRSGCRCGSDLPFTLG